MASRWTRLCVGLIAVVFTAALVGCGDDDNGGDGPGVQAAAPPTQLTVTTTDFDFSTDKESVPAGWVEITQVNEGEEPHEIQLFKLNEGATAEDFVKAEGPEVKELGVEAGGTGGSAGIEAGEEQTAILNLEEGNYAFICFVQGHHQKGMVAEFEVTAAEGGEQEAPTADGEIVTADFDIEMPDDFDGQGTYEITNNGAEPHEVTFYKVDGTLEEVEKYLASPQAFKAPPPGGEEGLGFGGGGAAIAPGTSEFIELDLDPGVYVAACFVPGKQGPHAFEGMALAVEV